MSGAENHTGCEECQMDRGKKRGGPLAAMQSLLGSEEEQ